MAAPAMYDPSPDVLRTLHDAFWSHGWRADRRDIKGELDTSPDLQAAVSAGVMFGYDRRESHDGWVAAAHQAAQNVTAEDVAAGFLASLSTRRLDLRSGLSSYVMATRMPAHSFQARPRNPDCPVCFTFDPDEVDLDMLSFQRFKWGGVWVWHIPYVAFDLEQFRRAPRPQVTEDDVLLGRRMLDTLRSLPAGTTATKAVTALNFIPGNKAEREKLMDILGICSILQAPGHPGHVPQFVPYYARELPPRRYIDRAYPACWWRSEYGINDEAVEVVLPHLA